MSVIEKTDTPFHRTSNSVPSANPLKFAREKWMLYDCPAEVASVWLNVPTSPIAPPANELLPVRASAGLVSMFSAFYLATRYR